MFTAEIRRKRANPVEDELAKGEKKTLQTLIHVAAVDVIPTVPGKRRGGADYADKTWALLFL